jgi:nucleotide-binding universal stress UspA family protein
MKLSTILVHLDHGEDCVRRVALAARLARQHNARLVGLVATGLRDGELAPDPHLLHRPEFMAASVNCLRARAQATAHLFNEWVRAQGPLSHEVRQVDGGSIDAMINHGHASDLLIVGQVDHARVDHDKTVDPTASALPAEALLHAGRPVLVVPFADPLVKTVATRIIVGWDGTREAAMALRDALPLMVQAEKVLLVSVCGEHSAPSSERLCIDETLAWLRRHGVAVQAEGRASTLSVAQTLWVCCSAFGADLLVAGGFGHSRFQQTLLGGTTREIMARMNLPVLLSH